MTTPTRTPAPVSVPTTTTTIGPLDRAAAPVSVAVDPELPQPRASVTRPTAVNTSVAASSDPGIVVRTPTVVANPTEDVPVSASTDPGLTGGGSNVTVSVPVQEAAVDTTPTTDATGNNIIPSTPRYVTVLEDGTVVVNEAAALNFSGSGVSVTAQGSTANIVITSGSSNYGNSNVAAFLAAYGSNTISTTGNITAGYLFGNGSQLTGLAATYSNSNVSTYLASGTNSSNIVTTANVSGANLITGGIVTATGNVRGANFNTAGIVSAAGNITGNYFIGNGSQLTGIATASTGNLEITGTLIEIASGATETSINISPSGPTGGWAYLQLPTNGTANTANTRLHNDAGNIEFGTGDFSTGETDYIWTLGNDGTMSIPGLISSSNTIEINNRATSNTADIRLNSADDIFLQGRDKPDDLEAEGGDIFLYGGRGAAALTNGFDTGGGGDVQIEGGIGGAGEVSGTGGGGGGIITIRGGDGGTSLDSTVGGGGDINLTAGSAPSPASEDPTQGGLGGGVNIIAGDTTRINENGGSIELTTGGASGDGTGAAGYVSINIASSNVGPGGQWIFSGTGTTLNVPANAEIFGASVGNFTVGCAGNTIITSSDYGANIKNWVFGYTGQTIFPTLSVTRGDRTGTLTGQTLLFGDSTQEAIISTPDGTNDINASQRFVINPGKGADGTTGEGGDIYLYAGRGGDAGGSGGDIKIRGGLAPLNGAGGYITIEGGEASADGIGGIIEIFGGLSGNATGGDLDLRGGLGQTEGGAVFIQGGQGQAGPGGPVNITGGVSGNGLAEYGNVGVIAGASSWVFNNTGNLLLPNDGVVYETNIPFGGLTGKTIALKPYGGTNADQQLLVYPTAGADFNHLHLTTGNLWNTEMFLGNDDFYVKLANTGNIVINSSDNTGNTAQWTFGTAGTILNSGNLTLQTPNGVPDAVTAITGSSGSWEANPVSNLATTGGTGSGLTVNVTQEGGYAGTIAIATAGTGYSNGDSISVVSGSSDASFTISVTANEWTIDTAGNLTVAGSIIMPPGTSLTGTGASPAPSINGFSTISSENVRTVSISVEGGRINGGFSTVVTDGINSIALALGAQMDVYGFPFSGGGVRGQLTISGVTTPSQANGTWYYQSINTYTYQIYTNSTYSTLVDASGWSAYTGGGNVAITLQDPASNVVINSNGYFSTFDNTGNLTLPGNLSVVGGTISLTGEGVLRSIDDTVALLSLNTSTGNANSVYLGSSGGLGFNDEEAGGNWLEIFRTGAEPQITVPVGRGNLNIQTASGNTPYNWTFGDTGKLTMPGPAQLAVYANATVRDSSISSPTPGMMIYVTGTGMQVRGATSWNTIAGSGT